MTSMTCNDIDDMSDSISTAVKAYRCHSAGLLGCTMLAYRPSWGCLVYASGDKGWHPCCCITLTCQSGLVSCICSMYMNAQLDTASAETELV